MKMKISALMISLSWSMILHAQYNSEITIEGSNKISKELTPKQVIDSLKKRFPNAQAVQYYKTSPEAVKKGWAINEEDNLTHGDVVENYTLSFKRDDFQYYALFDYQGNLLKSKYEQYDASVPEVVKTSLINYAQANNLKDYQVMSKTYYKRVNYDNKKEYYEVKAVNKKNKKDTKTITVSPEGEILKVKD